MKIDGLIVFDEDMNQLQGVAEFNSLVREEQYYDQGHFILVCPDTTHNVNLLKIGRFIYQTRYNTALLIKQMRKDSAERKMYVYGTTTLGLLDQRVIYPMLAITNTEQGMHKIVSDNLRDLKSVVSAPLNNYPLAEPHQFTGKEVLESLSFLGSAVGLGFKMVFDYKTKRHIFTPYLGANRGYFQEEHPKILFDEDLGGLENMVVADDVSDYKNVAYVAGAGEGADRTMVIAGATVGNARRELWVDAKDLQQEDGETAADYKERLRQRGLERLSERNADFKLSVEVDSSKFNCNYFLGDIVTIKSLPYVLQVNARILAFTDIDDYEGFRTRITLGEFEFIPIKGAIN